MKVFTRQAEQGPMLRREALRIQSPMASNKIDESGIIGLVRI